MPDSKDLWYKNAIIYGVDVGLFQGADCDGVGDLEGLTDRLGYIESLGVNCIWLGEGDELHALLNFLMKLNWIQQLARLRRRHRKVEGAAPQMIDTRDRELVGIGYAADDKALVTLHNLGKRQAKVQIALPQTWSAPGRVVHSSAARSGEPMDLNAPLKLEGYGALWIETRVETE